MELNPSTNVPTYNSKFNRHNQVNLSNIYKQTKNAWEELAPNFIILFAH